MNITLSGENGFGLQAKLKELTSKFIIEHGDFSLERLNAEEVPYARLAENIQAMPFLGAKRLVVIDSPAGNKELSENIKQILDSVNEETDLIFVQPKFDKRSVLYKALKKSTEFYEFNELDENELVRWAVGYVKNQGGTAISSDLRYLVQRVGANQLRVGNEIDKLLSYRPAITKSSIDLLTEQTPQSTIFQLLDAALAGNVKLAMNLYMDQRRQKVEPQAILALLAWQLHVLAVTKTAGNTPLEQIAKDAKINPFVVRKAAGAVRNISLSELKKLIHQTLVLDVRLKRESIDADEAVQNLLLTI